MTPLPLVAADVVITVPMPGALVSAGYLSLTNTTPETIRISHVVSPQFAAAEIHKSTLEDGVAKMRRIPELAHYTEIRPEVRYGTNSRIDFLLTGAGLPEAYVEVKNVHLMREPGLAEFPDSVTRRGAKHLDELAAMAAAGHRAGMLYCVQRTDCDRLALAADLDPGYAAAFARARAAGVEAMAWACTITVRGIALDRPIRIDQ